MLAQSREQAEERANQIESTGKALQEIKQSANRISDTSANIELSE